MRKKNLVFVGSFMLVAVAVAGSYYTYTSNSNVEESDLLMANVEALSSNSEGPDNTGPGKIYDCPGLGTGDGKMCMCENKNPCTQIPC